MIFVNMCYSGFLRKLVQGFNLCKETDLKWREDLNHHHVEFKLYSVEKGNMSKGPV